MKRILVAVLAMGLTLGTTIISFGMDTVHPDLAKASNCQRGDKIMNVLNKAEQKFTRAFPDYYPYEEWRVSQVGFHRIFARGQGKNMRTIELMVSHEGGVYFQPDTGDTVAMK